MRRYVNRCRYLWTGRFGRRRLTLVFKVVLHLFGCGASRAVRGFRLLEPNPFGRDYGGPIPLPGDGPFPCLG
jgi:hypothetical protein